MLIGNYSKEMLLSIVLKQKDFESDLNKVWDLDSDKNLNEKSVYNEK